MSVIRRLFQVARAGFFTYLEQMEKRKQFEDEMFENDAEDFDYRTEDDEEYSENRTWESGNTAETYSGTPQQIVDDLAVFNLTPPSSMEEVRKARNREIKKYHSDKFMNDPEKLETSKEIMQIVNAAYDRLKKYYQKP